MISLVKFNSVDLFQISACLRHPEGSKEKAEMREKQ